MMNRELADLRAVVQKLVPMLAGKGLVVTQRGARAYVQTDILTRKPVAVNIPSIGDNAEPDFIRAIQGFIDHEIAHVLLTDWNHYGGSPPPAPHEMGKPRVKILFNLHNIVEDTMIEREIVKIFPGSKRNLSDTRIYFLEKITKVALKAAKTPEEEFKYLFVPLMRALAGHREMVEFMDVHKYWDHVLIADLLRRLPKDMPDRLKTAETTKETLVIAEELMLILHGPEPKEEEQPEPEEDEEEEDDGESQDKPDQEAGEGDGDGERDHTEQGEEGAGDDTDDGGSEQKDGEAGDGDEADDGSASSTDGDDETTDDGGDDAGSEDADGDADEDDAADGAGKDESEEGDEDDGGSADGSDRPDGDDADAGDGDEGDVEDGEDDTGDDAGDGIDGGADDGEGSDGEDDAPAGSAGGAEDADDADEDGAGEPDGGASDAGLNDEPSEDSHDMDPASTGNQNAGTGSGGKSMFDYEDDAALEGVDLGTQLSGLLTKDAIDSMLESPWRVFSREWDRIEPIEAPLEMNRKWVPNLEDETRAMTGRMQKDIERIMASQSHVIRTPGHKTGKLHAPSLFRITQGDPRVFTQKQEHISKDTAVMLLVDNSGSMSGPKMRLAMISSFALSSTLERVNIPNEVIGFTTYSASTASGLYQEFHNSREAEHKLTGKYTQWDRMEPLAMPIYKTFDERINSKIKARVAYAMNAQKGLQGNIDGDCVMIAAERIARRTEKRKVMIVLSDGQPAAGPRGDKHLHWAVREIEKSGIECIGIGIMDQSVRRYYPKCVVLNNADDLPGQVMSEIKKLLM